MIKVFDRLQQLDIAKRLLIVALVISVLLGSPVYAFIVLIAIHFLTEYYETMPIAVGIIITTLLAFIISLFVQGSVFPELKSIFSVSFILFSVYPIRVLFICISGFVFLLGGNLMSSTMGDMQLEEARKERKELLKDGEFDYEYNGHMLTVGATGSAKTVFLNHIIKYGFEQGLFMCIMSAKIGRSDKYSMLKYVKKMAKAYNRKLYIVTMDKHLKNKKSDENVIICAYNPLPDCEWSELDNILANLITFSEPYYEDNFVMWICDIYDVLVAGNQTVSFRNILDLYAYKDYKAFVDDLLDSEIITQEQHTAFLADDIKEHEEIARQSKARLQRAFRNRQKTFETGKKISITQARKENAIIFFDMNGASAKNTTRALGAMAMGELQHVFSTEPQDTQDDRKLIIMDEISYYINDMTLPIFNLSRSAGYQCFMATQSFSDLQSKWLDSNFLNQMIANANQIGIMRQNTPDDADLAAKIADTTDVIELTKRVNGIDYDSAGSMKAIEKYIARPTLIKNLRTGEMVYITKSDDEGNKYHEASTSLLHWSYKDLTVPEPEEDTDGTIPNPQRRPAKLKKTSPSVLA